MKALFPEMEREILDDRKASRRERVQRARDYLRGRDISWIGNRLLDGPADEQTLLLAAMEEKVEGAIRIIYDLWALHLTKKLWRISLGVHGGSGAQSYLYGMRGVHPRPKKP